MIHKLTINTDNWSVKDIFNFVSLYGVEYDCKNEEIILLEIDVLNEVLNKVERD